MTSSTDDTPNQNAAFGNTAFADATPFGLVYESFLDDDGRFDLARLALRAQTDVLDFGLVVDAQVVVSDSLTLPPTPFDEFPRLATMTPSEHDLALLAAVRALILHELDVPVTIGKLPDVLPMGVPPVVAAARAAAVGLGLFERDDCEERYVVRTLPPVGDGEPAALMSTSIVNPTGDYYGLAYVRVGPLSRAADQAGRFADARGPLEGKTWGRNGEGWQPIGEQPKADRAAVSSMIRELRNS